MSWEDIERVVEEERAEEGHRKLGTRARSDAP
jgi:hypothetical protein